jgi:hypothetical protein
MAQVHSYEKSSNAPTDPVDAGEAQRPADTLPDSKSGPGNWGVAARWFLLALLAVGFFVCLYALR